MAFTIKGLVSDGTLPATAKSNLAVDITDGASTVGQAVADKFASKAELTNYATKADLDSVGGSGTSDDVYQAFDGYQFVSGPAVVGSGDSLTAGAGGNGTSWPTALGDIITKAYTGPGTIYNLGVGGETSATIAGRTGLGVPWVATVAGGQIPSSGGVTVTLASADGEAVNPLLQGSAGVNPVQIAGVTGNLTLSGGTYTFTREASGDPVTVDTPAQVTTKGQRERQSDIFVMWWGQNDGTSDASTIIARQQATIRRLKAFQKRWIVVGLPTGTRASRATMDAQFAAAYGDRFLNIREFLSTTDALTKEGITPTAADTTAISEGSTPPSLRSDGIHLNAAGYRRAGRAIYSKLKALGWNDQWGVLGDDADARIPTTYFSDDFERASTSLANTTTPVGARLYGIAMQANAKGYIDNGALAMSLNGDTSVEIYVNGGTGNGVLRSVLRTAGGNTATMLGRYANFQNYLRLWCPSGGQWALQQRINNVATDIATNLGASDDGDVLELVMNGTAGAVKINGTQVWSGAIPEISNGVSHGFQAYASGLGQRWDEFSLTEII